MPAVRVTRKGEERIEAGHPWIYESDIADRGEARAGDTVRVATRGGRALGAAHFSSASKITLRMLSRKAEAVNREFWMERLARALEYRRRVAGQSEAFRAVHAEGDLLPGLVVDHYGGYLGAQFLTQGMDRARGDILSCLEQLLTPKGVVARNDVPSRKHEDLPLEPEVLAGEIPERVTVRFNGLAWAADLRRGQKTGLYLDQRENYLAAARHAHGRALDCFTSAGGFALSMAARCERVEGVDSSAEALEAARLNASANGIGNVEFREANAFDYLGGCVAARRRFDTVVLDPPAFSKSRGGVESALRGYFEINSKALRLLGRGGVLVTCSCSHHVSEAALLELTARAALEAGRTLRVIERRTQCGDHPVLLTVPETMYLKCLIFEVM
jgi:23S rRNA (cytosine1962-C5)-methyltransferase